MPALQIFGIMKQDKEQACVAFHERAREIFFDLYRHFQSSVAPIDRQGDENVFQQAHGRYVAQLRQQLQGLAIDILHEADAGTDRNRLNLSLASFIDDYVHEFIQKVRSL